MAKTIATILGAGFLLIGIVGFIAPELMGMHLSMAHNIVHLVSGALALWVGLAGSHSAARSFCFFFGLVYGLLGVVGFLMGDPASDRLFTVIPDQLMLGRMDHIIHIVLGALFLIGALSRPAVAATTPTGTAEERR